MSDTASRILFSGDWHCGSHYGLWPEHDLPRGSRWSGARYLWRAFRHQVETLGEELAGEPVDILALSGDLVDGPQRKSAGAGVFSTVMGDQVEAAVEVAALLRPLARAAIRVEGTPYHESFDAPLRAFDQDPRVAVGAARQVFNLDLGDGDLLNFAHHPSGGSTLYEGTKLTREALLADVAAVRDKLPRARWIVRGHLHCSRLLREPDVSVVLLPCYQLATPHAVKQNLFKWQPDLGMVLMERDERERGGWRFLERLVANPRTGAASVTKLGEVLR